MSLAPASIATTARLNRRSGHLKVRDVAKILCVSKCQIITSKERKRVGMLTRVFNISFVSGSTSMISCSNADT